MPRVLHIVQSGDRGGVQRHVHDLALGLCEQTCGIASGSEGWLSQTAREAGIAVRALRHLQRSLDPRELALARRELAAACDNLAPNVVHAHGIFALLAALPLADRLPLVYTAHGFQWHDEAHSWAVRRLSLQLHRRAARKVAAFIAVASEGDEARRVGFRRVERISNGVALPEAGADPANTNTFGVATRLVPGKGLPEALAILAADPRLRLLVAGDGPMRRTLEAQAVGLGVGGRVEFLGWRDDLGAFYASIFAFVSLSQKEGLPYGVLDALAAGLPVVLSDIPGHRELVQHGRNGYLVSQGDASAAGVALQGLFADRALCTSAGAASRELVRTRYALASMLERHEELYAEMGGAVR
jgi:glycosyltransferase involved in cell wall biosynthesis